VLECEADSRGHVQGGSVVAEACNRVQAEVADVVGLTVVDVVEG